MLRRRGTRILTALLVLIVSPIMGVVPVGAQTVDVSDKSASPGSWRAIQFVPDLSQYPPVTRSAAEVAQEWAVRTGETALPPLLAGWEQAISVLEVPADDLTQPAEKLLQESDRTASWGDTKRTEQLLYAAALVADRRDDRITVGRAYAGLAAVERSRKRPVGELTYLLLQIDVLDHRVQEREMSPVCERIGALLEQLGDTSGAQIAYGRARTVTRWEREGFEARLREKYHLTGAFPTPAEVEEFLDQDTGRVEYYRIPEFFNRNIDLHTALRAFRAAWRWSRESGKPDPAPLYHLAALENLQGRWDRELYYLLEALQERHREPFAGHVADTLLEIGRVCLQLGETEAGQAALERAFAYRVFRNEREQVLRYLHRLGQSFREDLGDFNSALAISETMRQVSEGSVRWFTVGPPYYAADIPSPDRMRGWDRHYQTIGYLEAAKTYAVLGQRNEAIEALLAAESVPPYQIEGKEDYRRFLAQQESAETWEGLGLTDAAQSRFEVLERAIQQEHPAFVGGEHGDFAAQRQQAWHATNHAELLWHLGEHQLLRGRAADAHRVLTRAKDEVTPSLPPASVPYRTLPVFTDGEYPFARFRARVYPRILLSLGVACRELRRWDDAEKHLADARWLWRALGDPEAQAQVEIALSQVYTGKKDKPAALQALELALPQIRAVASPVARLPLLDRAAMQFLALGLPERTTACYEEALLLLDTLEARLLDAQQQAALRQTDVGGIYGRYVAALQRQGNTPPADLLTLVEQGRLRSYRSASRVSEQRLRSVASIADRNTWQATEREVVRLGRQLRAVQDASPESREAVRHALASAEERLHLLHVRLKSRLPQRPPTAPAMPDATALVSVQNPDTLYLEFVVTDRQTLLFSLHRGSVRCHVLPSGKNDLLTLVASWRAALTSTALEDIAHEQALAHRVFRTLLAPVEQAGLLANSGVRRLVIVPDGPLLDVPFAALARDTQGKSRLIDRYAISCALSLAEPGISGLSTPKSASSGPISPGPSGPGSLGDLLCVVDPLGAVLTPVVGTAKEENGGAVTSVASVSSVLRGRLGPLRHAQEEARQLQGLFPGAVTFSGSAAREAPVKEQLSQYRILHFATHGIADEGNGLRSWLLLAEETDESPEDGRLEADELAGMSLSAQMAVLSACRSGLGRTGGSAGILGFVWALAQAGCPAVVTTLWDVDDAATGRVMVSFYRSLLRGNTKDEALREAMRTERQKPGSLPRHWALLRITGDTAPLTSGGPASEPGRATGNRAAVSPKGRSR
ncbi:MAG: hypothetical protein OHK0029_05870 [Armatimonadaceae bacterium]